MIWSSLWVLAASICGRLIVGAFRRVALLGVGWSATMTMSLSFALTWSNIMPLAGTIRIAAWTTAYTCPRRRSLLPTSLPHFNCRMPSGRDFLSVTCAPCSAWPPLSRRARYASLPCNLYGLFPDLLIGLLVSFLMPTLSIV